MKLTDTFKEARRLYALGFAIHWLHPKSKRPIESGWTTGDRREWPYLAETYIDALNVGVRLGRASKIGERGFLAVVDVDVKSELAHHRKEAVTAAMALLGPSHRGCPEVRSGRGNGSRHYYCLTKEPFKTFDPATSTEVIKVHMPSKKPSKKELEQLSPKEIADGIRLSAAWGISLYSEGRQVVLPPSIHPDSGKPYFWNRHLAAIEDLPVIAFDIPKEVIAEPKFPKGAKAELIDAVDDFVVSPVDLEWSGISDKVLKGITTGEGVTDRSGYLLAASLALHSAELSKNEILTVLTDPKTFLGVCAYEHAQTKSRAKAAAWVWRYTLKRIMEERDPASVFSKVAVITPKLTAEEVQKQSEEIADEIKEPNWRLTLERTGKHGEGPPKSTIKNVTTILSNMVDPLLFKRNTFAFRDIYGAEAPWGGEKDDLISDDDTPKIKLWMGERFKIEPSREVISDSMVVLACRNSFDPVKDWLDQLPAWDKVNRLDTWLKINFEAEGNEEYLAQVFRKWMVAMVLRVYEPGAKFDWMPIFEGKQGVGKSSFGRILCGNKYFLDWLPDLADKDSALSLQGIWCVELGELASLRKNELETIKAFLTRTVDKFRPPHGKRTIESARRCVFFGTTNRDTYLRDDSGNRRFKPVKVGELNFAALERDREQLFAEAKHLYDGFEETEFTLELNGEAKVFEHQIQAEKMVDDDSTIMAEQIRDYVEKNPSFNVAKFRMNGLFSGIGPLFKWRLDGRNLQFASKALKSLGGQKWKSDGLVYWKIGENRF